MSRFVPLRLAHCAPVLPPLWAFLSSVKFLLRNPFLKRSIPSQGFVLPV